MNIAIVGAGVAGLAAAYDLARAGQQVTIFEAAAQAGGLASGFKAPHWEWPLERFYHHLFETDTAIRELVDAIGYRDKLFFKRPVTAHWAHGHGYPIDGVLPILRFPELPFLDRLRFGLTGAYLKFAVRDWQRLERTTVTRWTRRWMGPAAYGTIMQPLLVGKFGPYADEVNMAWLWARFKARSFHLGYFAGGFQGFADALLTHVTQLGTRSHFVTPVHAVRRSLDGWVVESAAGHEAFDAVLVTGSPSLLTKLAPELPESYLARLGELRSIGAVVLTLALSQPLTNGLYWVNMPKDEFPFLALVEHTNFVDRSHYGGDHLVYLGDYLAPSHEFFHLAEHEIVDRFLPALRKVNPAFDRSWVRGSWLHREAYAQPVVPVGHSANIPAIATPLPGLYWASMSQVYPWDRGTNFAVELGRQAAQEMLSRPVRTAPTDTFATRP